MAEEPKEESKTMKEETATTSPEKTAEGRRGSEVEMSGKELTDRSEKEGKELNERSEKEESRVSKKSAGSTKSRGSKKSSKSKASERKEPMTDTSETKTPKKKKSDAETTGTESQTSETKKSKKKKRKEGTTDKQASARKETEASATASRTTSKISASKKKDPKRSIPPDPSATAKPEEPAQQHAVPQIANLGGVDFISLRVLAMGFIFALGGIMAILTFLGILRHRDVLKDLPCVGEQCQEVVRLTESFMDHSVNPCHDFYRHVCGRWMRDTHKPSSFMIDVARNMTDVWHQALTKDHTKGDYHELRQGAAFFYRSCLTFLEQQTDIAAAAQELFKALNLPVSKWLAETRWEQFFHNVLHLSVVSRFHTLVNIDATLRETKRTIQIRRQPPFHGLVRPMYHDHLAKYVRNAVRDIGKEQASDAVIEEVLNLDITRAKRTGQDSTSQQQQLDDINCQGFPAKLWRKVLEKDLSLPEQVDIKIMQADQICKDLKVVLVDTHSAARPVYIFTLLVGHVLKYDYELSENRAANAIKDVCYQATSEAYEDIWLHLMSSFLSLNKEIEVAFDNYVDFIAAQAKILVRSRSWMSERDRSTTLGKLGKIRMYRFYGAHMTEQAVECHSGKLMKVDAFVSNMVALRARDVKHCLFVATTNSSDYNDRRILTGSDLVVDPESLKVHVPASFAIAPLYYRHVKGDRFINIAVVVMHLARNVLSLLDRKSFNPASTSTTSPGMAAVDNEATSGSGSRWSLSTQANYSSLQQCYSRVSAHFHETLRDDQFDDAFSVVEAMRLAHDAKCEYDLHAASKNEARVRSSNAVFFKRACLSLCTSRNASRDGANTLDFATAYASCLFGVANLPEFAEAFGCKPGDPMWKINRCCVD